MGPVRLSQDYTRGMTRSSRRGALVALLSLALTVFACTPSPRPSAGIGTNLSPSGLARQRVVLEQRRNAQPRSVETRLALGEVYYRIARDALDRTHDEEAYLTHLELATDEFLTALELDPRLSQPHTYLGAMDTYRGDLDAALRSMRNARRLDESPIHVSNIAEMLIYRDNLDQAREWNALAARKGAPYGAVTFNAMLIAWKSGNLRLANENFERLAVHAPEMLREINMARVPAPPRRFQEFAGYCCDSPACGPYMRDACTAASQEITEREMTLEALRREMEIERERRKRLEEIYEGRRELEIEVEPKP